MRLSQIKLAGFKSFVEPTTLLLPSNRVGIVGPNGCGKSNVIDAIRWVMGESSAKHLRGAAMIDVIFNGSRTRAALEQAVIELVFKDVNQPQYPQQSEIAVKRQLSRDGQSTYFLNNVRCRRKDITDLFLGTGLGPRSYAIIEQGMISRLIEAKPDELRVFLEEAAGISKYKERRKETEQRMRQTRENIARLNDVRTELARQLDRLQKQAKQAEKYQQLKQSEHLLKAQLCALRWDILDARIQAQQQTIDEQATDLQQDLLQLQTLEETHQQQRATRTVAQTTLEAAQTRYYALDNEIQRLEQTLTTADERYSQWQWELEQIEADWETAQQQLIVDTERQHALAVEIEQAHRQGLDNQAAEDLAEQALQAAEAQSQQGQAQWDAFNQQAALPTQRAQVARSQMQTLEQQLVKNQQRWQRLAEEAQGLHTAPLEQTLNQLAVEITATKTALEEAETTCHHHQEAVTTLRETIQKRADELHHQQARVHHYNGRLASLETLQEAALGKSHADLEAWLHAQGLPHPTRLVQVLQVTPGWERAVEVVLGALLQAFCVDDLTALLPAVAHPPQGRLILLACQATPANETVQTGRLSAKVQAPPQLAALLTSIWTADTLAAAYQLQSQLTAQASVITPDGIWLGRHWLRSEQGVDEQAGLLAREKEIQQIAHQLEQWDATLHTLTQTLEQQRLTLYQHENQREQAQQQVNTLQKHLAQQQTQHSNQQTRLAHIVSQQQRIQTEQAELTAQLQADEETLATTRQQLHADLALMEQLAEERAVLMQQRQWYQEHVVQCRQAWTAAKEVCHQQATQLTALRSDALHLQQAMAHQHSQIEQLTEQRYNLQNKLADQTDPLETLHLQLETCQQEYQVAKESWLQAKQTVTHLEQALSDYEAERDTLTTRSQTLRTYLEQARMACQADEVRRQTLEEQLAEMAHSPVALLAELPEYADESSWQAQIEAVERKLERLGAVNLAALAEYEEQIKRKQYLDEQAEDLNHALSLLENAIRTIDRETRLRFQNTLEQVNAHLQTLFPRLFGGGQASLQLTETDVLKAGVTIVAQPPGKRNSHIHLLSGGEKALTAIALVFAIFELNPAPFCLLDEVDAPLDDANVGRFCALVKAMSERVQFIFISHNKMTMEIADQLIGVTMQEAGVSRLVTVDVDTAVDMVTV